MSSDEKFADFDDLPWFFVQTSSGRKEYVRQSDAEKWLNDRSATQLLGRRTVKLDLLTINLLEPPVGQDPQIGRDVRVAVSTAPQSLSGGANQNARIVLAADMLALLASRNAPAFQQFASAALRSMSPRKAPKVLSVRALMDAMYDGKIGLVVAFLYHTLGHFPHHILGPLLGCVLEHIFKVPAPACD